MSRFLFAIIFLLFVGTPGYSLDPKPTEPKSSPAEALSDVDFSPLDRLPQLNWGIDDPFSRKPGYVQIDPNADFTSPDKFHLNAIIFDNDDPLAIINGKTIGVGDDIEGLDVEEIAPNYVVLHSDDVRFELTLNLPREPKPRAEIKSLDSPEEKEHE